MRLYSSLLSIVLMMVCVPVFAQKAPAEERAFHEVLAHEDAFLSELGLDQQELYDLIQSYMLVRIKRTLDLTDVQTLNLMKRVGKYKDQLTRLKFNEGLLVSQLRMLLSTSSTEASIQESLTQLLDNEQKTVATLLSMVTEAGDELSVAQRAQLYLFVGDFEEDIRRMAFHAQRLNQEGHQRYTK